MKTVSAPGGMGAPVKMRMAWPGGTGAPAEPPAWVREATTKARASPAGRSSPRTA